MSLKHQSQIDTQPPFVLKEPKEEPLFSNDFETPQENVTGGLVIKEEPLSDDEQAPSHFAMSSFFSPTRPAFPCSLAPDPMVERQEETEPEPERQEAVGMRRRVQRIALKPKDFSPVNAKKKRRSSKISATPKKKKKVPAPDGADKVIETPMRKQRSKCDKSAENATQAKNEADMKSRMAEMANDVQAKTKEIKNLKRLLEDMMTSSHLDSDNLKRESDAKMSKMEKELKLKTEEIEDLKSKLEDVTVNSKRESDKLSKKLEVYKGKVNRYKKELEAKGKEFDKYKLESKSDKKTLMSKMKNEGKSKAEEIEKLQRKLEEVTTSSQIASNDLREKLEESKVESNRYKKELDAKVKEFEQYKIDSDLEKKKLMNKIVNEGVLKAKAIDNVKIEYEARVIKMQNDFKLKSAEVENLKIAQATNEAEWRSRTTQMMNGAKLKSEEIEKLQRLIRVVGAAKKKSEDDLKMKVFELANQLKEERKDRVNDRERDSGLMNQLEEEQKARRKDRERLIDLANQLREERSGRVKDGERIGELVAKLAQFEALPKPRPPPPHLPILQLPSLALQPQPSRMPQSPLTLQLQQTPSKVQPQPSPMQLPHLALQPQQPQPSQMPQSPLTLQPQQAPGEVQQLQLSGAAIQKLQEMSQTPQREVITIDDSDSDSEEKPIVKRETEVKEVRIAGKFIGISKLTEVGVYSQPMECDGIIWVVRRMCKDGHTYFYLDAENKNEVEWWAPVIAEFRLISHNSEKNVYKRTIKHVFGPYARYQCLTYIADMELFNAQNGYVKDDAIIVDVAIRPFPRSIHELSEMTIQGRFSDLSKLSEARIHSLPAEHAGVTWRMGMCKYENDICFFLNGEKNSAEWWCPVIVDFRLLAHKSEETVHLSERKLIYDAEKACHTLEIFKAKDLFDAKKGYVMANAINVAVTVKAFLVN